ncbi:MAG: hypothetical protein GAK34_00028 [Delftia tsuruhatensis]|nr:MAG: hypothetical protein GAK34_00028 [Delftia tsuruhatensis]
MRASGSVSHGESALPHVRSRQKHYETESMMGEFEAIRPYNDAEVPAVLKRLLGDEAFLDILVRYRFGRLAGALGWLLRPLIARRLAREVSTIDSIGALQDRIENYVDRTIEKATDGVTYSGVERLKAGGAYLFIANHRDIVMDPAFVNYAVYHAGLPTPRIAIGDNLLQKPFVSDLMRLNKSFIVHRSISGRREKLAAYTTLSAYINHSIRVDGQSIWIAQAEGRAKDGDDRTDSAILKMFHMSRKDEPFAEVIRSLRLVPVSISYEYDPCDAAKARELYLRATTGEYRKTPGEDDTSIALGITGYKGRVHINFGHVLEGEYPDAKRLATDVDREILGTYRLFPAHYLAYEMFEGRDASLEVPSAASLFPAEELQRARSEWQRRLDGCPVEHRPYLVLQYATPVLNHFRLPSAEAPAASS